MASNSNIVQATQQFFQDLVRLPVDKPLNSNLENATVAEHELRLLFRAGHQIGDHFLGLVNVFNLNAAARRTRARHVEQGSNDSEHYIFPLSPSRRRRDSIPSTVSDIETFQKHWEIFTHGVLSEMRPQDWDNVVAVGGSVLACLMPAPDTTERRINKKFQSGTWASSAIDLFLWGLSPEQAEVKMRDIYQAICSAAHYWKVVCVRRAGIVSIHTTYPYRPVQIILRLYQSPAEILAEIDVDAGCLLYNGKEVWANPRAMAALVRQINTVDTTLVSPSYEMRLAKYAERGFEVFVPSLDRGRVKASLYDRNMQVFPNGLARLLVLEEAYYHPFSYAHLQYPKPVIMKLPRDISNEELRWAHIPYGPSWDARTIKDLITRQDAYVDLQVLYDPPDESQNQHRHMFFVGSMGRCIRPVCRDCEFIDGMRQRADFEAAVFEEPDPQAYIKGPLSFMVSPRRQLMTGGAVALGEWEQEAYEKMAELGGSQARVRIEVVDSDSEDTDSAEASSRLFA